MQTTTALELFDAGYRGLVSVIPPGSKLSTESKIDPTQLGKVPGRRNAAGAWGGYDWRGFEAKRAHVELWQGQGANIGLRAAEYPAVDIDCSDPGLSAHLLKLAVQHLGPAPVRTGRAPKALLVYRTANSFGRLRLWLTEPDGVAHLIEVLGDGQQYVVAGTHPSGTAYTWDRPLHKLHPTELTLIDPEAVEAFFQAVEADADLLGLRVEREGLGGTSVDRAGVSQEALAAPSFEALERIVGLLPNGETDFPGRDDYLRVGYAIKAAGGEDALPLFVDWGMRWCGNDREAGNTPEGIEADWSRMVPPFEVGFRYLLDKAQELAGYNSAQDEFEATEELPTPPEAPENAPAGRSARPAVPPEPAPTPAAAVFQSSAVYSDTAAATKLLNARPGRVRYCDALGGWLLWDRGRWQRDETGRTGWWALRVANDYAAKAIADDTLKASEANGIARRLCSAGAKDAILSAAKVFPSVATAHDQFDVDPMALNTPAGLLDLRTGELRGVDDRPLVTRQTAVPPQRGPHPLWSRFLLECTNGDRDIVDYLQRLAGYCLTGLTTEQILVFMWGPGGNGKSVFASTLASVMGDYAIVTSPETFAVSQHDRHPTEIARMRGARLVTSTETQEGRPLDEAKVKQMTGGDKVSARFMNKDLFEFTPAFKIVMLGNHRPSIRNLDVAMRRRLQMIPFTNVPRRVDRELSTKLKAEWPAILQWAIDGCIGWQLDGLGLPKVAADYTRDYFAEEDPIGVFLEERCVVRDGARVQPQPLFEQWAAWAHERNEYVGTQKRFLSLVSGRPGIQKYKDPTTGLRGLQGVELLYEPGEFEAQDAPGRAAESQSSSSP